MTVVSMAMALLPRDVSCPWRYFPVLQAGMVYLCEGRARHKHFTASLLVFSCVGISVGIRCREDVRPNAYEKGGKALVC